MLIILFIIYTNASVANSRQFYLAYIIMVLHCFQRPKVGQILRLVCAVVLVPTEKPVSAFTVFHYVCFILRLSLPMLKVPFHPRPGSIGLTSSWSSRETGCYNCAWLCVPISMTKVIVV